MNICAFTSGASTPSSRFRIRQHIPGLDRLGMRVVDHCPLVNQHARLPGALGRLRKRHVLPLSVAQIGMNALLRLPGIAASRHADAVWIERNFVPGLESWVKFAGRPRVLDIDDAVWLEGLAGKHVEHLVANVDAVMAGNTFLADWASQRCKQVSIVPTAIDCQRFTPRSPTPADRTQFTIGWTGTSGNFAYLDMIASALGRFLKSRPDSRFVVIADRAPALPDLPAAQVRFEPWRADTEAALLHQFDVGLMPLSDSEWARGKCSFKMLQYMASGLPTVASPVGMNRQVLSDSKAGFAAQTDDDWIDALETLRADEALRAGMGALGRAAALARYDTPVVSKLIAEAFTRATSPV